MWWQKEEVWLITFHLHTRSRQRDQQVGQSHKLARLTQWHASSSKAAPTKVTSLPGTASPTGDKVLIYMSSSSIFLFHTTTFYPGSQLAYGNLRMQNPLAQIQNFSVLSSLKSLQQFKVTSKSQGKLLIVKLWLLQKINTYMHNSILWHRIYIT